MRVRGTEDSTNLSPKKENSVVDPDPYVLGLLDPDSLFRGTDLDPGPLVRGTDLDPGPLVRGTDLDPGPDPSIIKQK